MTAALLLPLVYYKSGWGASAGMALGEFLMMILLYREINGRIPFQLMAAVLKPLGASLLMGMCVLVTLPAGLFLSVAAGMIVYAGVISLMNGVTREDIVFLKGRFL
ncbi:MAG: polysaccharide biosynthesis C-terminal domain-containing protein [Ignavibacteriales bacterium]|nr:polysaccharide biosynthesis C-terminal domain-containing protein [Ignavibacteriales bacterium]